MNKVVIWQEVKVQRVQTKIPTYSCFGIFDKILFENVGYNEQSRHLKLNLRPTGTKVDPNKKYA